MWLRDSLPGHVTSETDGKPMARVMVYGYESAVAKSKCMQNIEDLSTTFHNSLLASVGASPTRPIILIGHSLGGLIIKQVSIPTHFCHHFLSCH
jgi:alpha-beta hydrolase superfamily lysophospholipase